MKCKGKYIALILMNIYKHTTGFFFGVQIFWVTIRENVLVRETCPSIEKSHIYQNYINKISWYKYERKYVANNYLHVCDEKNSATLRPV